MIMQNSGRNITLDYETAKNYAKTRPESRIGLRSGRWLCKNPAGISHWTAIWPMIMQRSGRNLTLDGDSADDYAKIWPESRIGLRSGRWLCKNPAGISQGTEKWSKIMLKSGRNLASGEEGPKTMLKSDWNLALHGETADNYVKIRLESGCGWRSSL